MMKTIVEYFHSMEDDRREALLEFHLEFEPLMRIAKGSSHNHQAWEGGYISHITELFHIAEVSYAALGSLHPMPFPLDQALIVLYMHDIEKIWQYSTGETIDKDDWYNEILPKRGITLTDSEMNALEHIHGEQNHVKTERRMNELGAFCHSCDCLSARLFWDYGRDFI